MKTYSQEFSQHRTQITLIAIAMVISYCFYFFANDDLVIELGKEDGFFENMTALCFFIGFALLLLTFIKTKNVLVLLLGLVFFFGAGEEISWGQRILHYCTPQNINKLNVQGEFNIHNLEVFNGVKLDGSKSSGWHKFLGMNFLFKLFTLTIAVLMPLFAFHSKFFSSFFQKIKAPIAPFSIGFLVIINIVIVTMIPKPASTLADYISIKNAHHVFLSDYTAAFNKDWNVFARAAEIYEFLAALILMVICRYFYKNQPTVNAGLDYKQAN